MIAGQSLISYGSCQFPTLGFVVERYKAIQDFVGEAFWKIKVSWEPSDEEKVDFLWKRHHLFDQLAVRVLHERYAAGNRFADDVIIILIELQVYGETRSHRCQTADQIQEQMEADAVGHSGKCVITLCRVAIRRICFALGIGKTGIA